MTFLAHGYPALDSLFDVVSAVGTVGLSTGVVSHELPAVLKLVLCLDKLMGRVEIFAILVLLNPASWIGRRAHS
ncbi:MAG: potassium transporter TrkG [Oceanidesulfovibrio sp.]